MAQHTIINMTCDLGHRGQPTEATFSHEIVVDGKPFRVDVCDTHNEAFDREVGKYCVTPLPKAPFARRRVPLYPKEQVQAARAWAQANGYEVSDRGRVPYAVMEAYSASN